MNKEIWHIDRLKNWERNPRSIKKDDFERLKKQISTLGQYRPLVVTPDGIVLGGNMRLRAYKELGINDIWVSVVEAKDEKAMLEYALSDNDRAGNYDETQLGELIQDSGIDLDMYKVDLGNASTLSELMAQLGPEVVEDEPPEPSDEPTDTKAGDVFELGRHRLMCGDSTKREDLDLLMAGKRADMVFTDPPYNVDYSGGMHADGTQSKRDKIKNDKMSSEQFYDFLSSVMKNLLAVTSGAFYVCMSSSELHNLWKAFTDNGGHWQTYIIWAKDAFTLSRSDYQHQFEPIMYGLAEDEIERAVNEVDEDKLPIMYGWSKHNWYGGRKQGDVWRIDRPKVSKEHPTMKPIALCAKAIKNSSTINNIILDVFGGSGSTLMACEQTDRICYMSEIDPKYVDVIIKRWEDFTGEKAKKVT